VTISNEVPKNFWNGWDFKSILVVVQLIIALYGVAKIYFDGQQALASLDAKIETYNLLVNEKIANVDKKYDQELANTKKQYEREIDFLKERLKLKQ
jgi:hypothetical protein